MTVRILADDLTGALDAAAPFARPGAPARLLMGAAPAGGGAAALSISSESRDVPEAAARAAVGRAFAALEAADGADTPPVWFKKVDSVLRGNSLPDTLETMRLGGFDTCLFAPAFPEMGRRTRAGMHEVRSPAGWAPAPVHDLAAAFAALGAQARPLAPDAPDAPGTGLLIGDVTTPEDLGRAVAALRDAPSMLWAGSRGLAEALSRALQGEGAPLPLPRIATVINGTATEASRAQIERARGLFGPRCTLVDPVPRAATPEATLHAIASAAAGIDAGPDRALMVIGGDTLSALLEACGAVGLDCLGEVGPGLPLSRIRGGRLDGVQMLTKSGGFGDADLLVRIVAEGRV